MSPLTTSSSFLDRTATATDPRISALKNSTSKPPGQQNQVPGASEAEFVNSVERVSKEFEGMVLGFFLNLMFKNIGKDDLMGDRFAEDMYRDLLVEEYGRSMSEGGGLGIAETVQRQLIQIQASGLNNDDGTTPS